MEGETRLGQLMGHTKEGTRAREEGEESTRERAREGETVEGETRLGQSMGRTKGGRKSAREIGGEHARGET